MYKPGRKAGITGFSGSYGDLTTGSSSCFHRISPVFESSAKSAPPSVDTNRVVSKTRTKFVHKNVTFSQGFNKPGLVH